MRPARRSGTLGIQPRLTCRHRVIRLRAHAPAVGCAHRESLPDDRRMLIESYRFVHIARKVVGVGSVGTRCWVVLLTGHGITDLGWYTLMAWDGREHEYYVRQLWDGKASIDVARLTPKGLSAYGEMCGWTLARGHARSGDRIALAGYLGEDQAFDRAIASFASAYAETNEADHQRLLEAIADQRIPAEAA